MWVARLWCCLGVHYVTFFFNDPPTTEIYTLSLHDALPIYRAKKSGMVNITSSVNSRERSGINTTGYIDHAAPLPTVNTTRSEERFSRNAETDLVCRLLLEKKNTAAKRAVIHCKEYSRALPH